MNERHEFLITQTTDINTYSVSNSEAKLGYLSDMATSPSQLYLSSHVTLIFLRPFRVLSHTASKLECEQKFCVTAMVGPRLSTPCHHPPGTKTVSPGSWINS
jgi:hypothetical protein